MCPHLPPGTTALARSRSERSCEFASAFIPERPHRSRYDDFRVGRSRRAAQSTESRTLCIGNRLHRPSAQINPATRHLEGALRANLDVVTGRRYRESGDVRPLPGRPASVFVAVTDLDESATRDRREPAGPSTPSTKSTLKPSTRLCRLRDRSANVRSFGHWPRRFVLLPVKNVGRLISTRRHPRPVRGSRKLLCGRSGLGRTRSRRSTRQCPEQPRLPDLARAGPESVAHEHDVLRGEGVTPASPSTVRYPATPNRGFEARDDACHHDRWRERRRLRRRLDESGSPQSSNAGRDGAPVLLEGASAVAVPSLPKTSRRASPHPARGISTLAEGPRACGHLSGGASAGGCLSRIRHRAERCGAHACGRGTARRCDAIGG